MGKEYIIFFPPGRRLGKKAKGAAQGLSNISPSRAGVFESIFFFELRGTERISALIYSINTRACNEDKSYLKSEQFLC